MALDPDVWGPKYWFVLHSIALTYPHTVNDVTKKKILRIYTKFTSFFT